MRVRPAEPTDLEVLVGFIAEEAREAGEGEKDRATLEQGIRAGLEDQSVARYWVLLDGSGLPCGSISVTREWSDWNAYFYWWIQSIYIVPDQRGKGFINLLLEAVTGAARADGCGDLRLYVHRHNRRAIRAYEKTGFGHAPYRIMSRKVLGSG